MKFGIFIIFIWILFSLCSQTLLHPKGTEPSLIHDAAYLIVPEKSSYRKAIIIKAVEKTKVSVPLTVPGVVNADPEFVLDVFPPLVGRIVAFHKKWGDFVNAGDILFTMHSADFAQIQSDLNRTRASFLLATQILERQKKLRLASIASQSELQAAQNNFDQTQAEFNRVETQLHMIQLKENKNEPSTLTVRASFSGYVTDVYASVGVYWNDITTPVMRITDLSHVYVSSSIQEKDIAHFHVGQPIDFVFDAFPKVTKATIDWINPVLDPDTRTMKVNSILQNEKGVFFLPNMFVRGIVQGNPHDAILLPVTSVLQRGFDSVIFVEVAPWKFQARIVKTGYRFGDNIEILSGLEGNERVVVKGGILLND